MTDTSPPPRLLTRPVRAWGSLSRSTQFALYMRVSLQSLVVVLAATSLAGLVGNDLLLENFAWAVIAYLVWVVVLAGTAVVFLHRAPELRTGVGDVPHLSFRLGIALCVISLLGAGVVILTGAGWREFGFLLLFLSHGFLAVYLGFVRHRWVLFAVLTGIAVAAGLFVTEGNWGATLTLAVLLPSIVLVTVVTTVWCVRLMKEADRAVELQKTLSVTEERLRFAQELHDTMGQHLAAMSVKAELALALARRGDDRLEGELEALQRLTRTTTAELREVVDGNRWLNLATEIAGARRLLESAGIRVEVTGDAFDVPAAHREDAAWFVREASTNVLKHADASVVTVGVDGASISMGNDRPHPASGRTGRTGGLDALRRRTGTGTGPGAGQLSVERDNDSFTVTLTF